MHAVRTQVPALHISKLKVYADMKALHITVVTRAAVLGTAAGATVKLEVVDPTTGAVVATKKGAAANAVITLPIASPKLWSPESPFLYDLTVTLSSASSAIPPGSAGAGAGVVASAGVVDVVNSYFGMREVSLCLDPKGVTR